jgi:hypothetical protein
MMPLSKLSEECLDLVTLVSSMPGLRHILEIRLWQAIVSVMPQEAAKGDPITKLNSRLELSGGPVDKILDLHALDGLTPLEELFR